MPLVPAKCPECGGLVEVDNEKRAAICQHCGEAFTIEDAVQNFNTYYNITNNYNSTTNNTHNYGDGAVVNVYENENKDFIIESGVLKSYKGADNVINVPNGVFEISAQAFKDLPVETLNISDSVNNINIEALRNARYINNITVDDNSVYKYENGLLIKDSSILWANKNISELIIPQYVDTVWDRAFENCKELLEVHLPENIIKIGNGAFSGCDKLLSFEFPNNLSAIGVNIFNSINKISKLTVRGELYQFPNSVDCLIFENVKNIKHGYCGKIETVIIGDNCIIEYDAFAISEIKELLIGNNCLIEGRAFRSSSAWGNDGCSINHMTIGSNTKIMSNAFRNASIKCAEFKDSIIFCACSFKNARIDELSIGASFIVDNNDDNKALFEEKPFINTKVGKLVLDKTIKDISSLGLGETLGKCPLCNGKIIPTTGKCSECDVQIREQVGDFALKKAKQAKVLGKGLLKALLDEFQ